MRCTSTPLDYEYSGVVTQPKCCPDQAQNPILECSTSVVDFLFLPLETQVEYSDLGVSSGRVLAPYLSELGRVLARNRVPPPCQARALGWGVCLVASRRDVSSRRVCLVAFVTSSPRRVSRFVASSRRVAFALSRNCIVGGGGT